MGSLKYLLCGECNVNATAPRVVRWSPSVVSVSGVTWESTSGIGDEVVYLNFLKVMESEDMLELLTRCVRSILGESSSFGIKLRR